MDVLIGIGVRLLEGMFAVGIVFSTTAIVFGTIDFAHTVLDS
jgi:hypothetical protein